MAFKTTQHLFIAAGALFTAQSAFAHEALAGHIHGAETAVLVACAALVGALIFRLAAGRKAKATLHKPGR